MHVCSDLCLQALYNLAVMHREIKCVLLIDTLAFLTVLLMLVVLYIILLFSLILQEKKGSNLKSVLTFNFSDYMYLQYTVTMIVRHINKRLIKGSLQYVIYCTVLLYNIIVIDQISPKRFRLHFGH